MTLHARSLEFLMWDFGEPVSIKNPFHLLGINRIPSNESWEIQVARRTITNKQSKTHPHETPNLRGLANCANVHELMQLSLNFNGRQDYSALSLSLSLSVQDDLMPKEAIRENLVPF